MKLRRLESQIFHNYLPIEIAKMKPREVMSCQNCALSTCTNEVARRGRSSFLRTTLGERRSSGKLKHRRRQRQRKRHPKSAEFALFKTSSLLFQLF